MSDAEPFGRGFEPQPLAAAPRLALLEVLDADGRLLRDHDVRAWPLRLGRALDNDVVLHDPHAAAHHARITPDVAGTPRLVVVESRNGVRLEGPGARTLASGESALLPPLALWRVGDTCLRLRLPADPLPDERRLAAAQTPPSKLAIAALALGALGWQAGNLWLRGNPSTTWEAYALPLVGLVSTLVLWLGLWALLSKLFTHRVELLGHLRIALGYTLAGFVGDTVLSLVAYMFDWPWASRIREPLGIALIAAMICHHLSLVLPAQRRRLPLVLAGMAGLAIAGQMGLQWQRSDRLFRELYLSTLAPPALRFARGEPPQALVESLRTLEGPLLERAKADALREGEP